MHKLYNGVMIFSGELESMWKEAAVICFMQQHLIGRIVKKHAYNQYNLKSDRYSNPGPPE